MSAGCSGVSARTRRLLSQAGCRAVHPSPHLDPLVSPITHTNTPAPPPFLRIHVLLQKTGNRKEKREEGRRREEGEGGEEEEEDAHLLSPSPRRRWRRRPQVNFFNLKPWRSPSVDLYPQATPSRATVDEGSPRHGEAPRPSSSSPSQSLTPLKLKSHP